MASKQHKTGKPDPGNGFLSSALVFRLAVCFIWSVPFIMIGTVKSNCTNGGILIFYEYNIFWVWCNKFSWYEFGDFCLCRSTQALSGLMGSVTIFLFSGLSRYVQSGSCVDSGCPTLFRHFPKNTPIFCWLSVLCHCWIVNLPQPDTMSALEQFFLKNASVVSSLHLTLDSVSQSPQHDTDTTVLHVRDAFHREVASVRAHYHKGQNDEEMVNLLNGFLRGTQGIWSPVTVVLWSPLNLNHFSVCLVWLGSQL